MKAKYNFHPLDLHIGQMLKTIRIAWNLSQEELSGQIGISLRQLQRYEGGTGRVPASLLYDLADILNVPVMDFYRGLGFAGSVIRDLNRRDYLLIGHLGAIRDKEVRKAVRLLVSRLAGN